MAPVTRESFRDRLAALSPDALAAFVADLWAERGLEVDRSGSRIDARDPVTGVLEGLYVLPTGEDPATAPEEGVDVVVAVQPARDGPHAGGDLPADVRPIDAEELRRIVLYAIDRDAATGLLEEHLGYGPPRFPVREPTGRPDPDGLTAERPTRDGPRGSLGSRAVAGGSGAVAGGSAGSRDAAAVDGGDATGGPSAVSPTLGRRSALLGGVVLAGIAFVGLRSSGRDGWASLAGGPATSGDHAAGGDPSESPGGTSGDAGAPLVPWLTRDGVVDPPALAEAHARRLRDTSYGLEVERTVRAGDGSLHSRLRVDVSLAVDRTYVARVETAGPHAPAFLGIPPAQATFWSDGDTYVRRFSRGGEVTHNQFEPPDNHAGSWRYWVHTVPFGGQDGSPRAFITALFEGVRSRFAGPATANGREAFRIASEGERPTAGTFRFAGDLDAVEDVSVDALVEPDGLVASLDLSYAGEHGDGPVSVRRSVRYRGLGATAVGRPTWYAKAVEGATPTSKS